jgi:hypothetical protein
MIELQLEEIKRKKTQISTTLTYSLVYFMIVNFHPVLKGKRRTLVLTSHAICSLHMIDLFSHLTVILLVNRTFDD